jgi:hypothetical protein
MNFYGFDVPFILLTILLSVVVTVWMVVLGSMVTSQTNEKLVRIIELLEREIK